MRKLLLSITLTGFLVAASTQESNAQFGIQAGVMLPQGNIDVFDAGFGGNVFYKKEANDMKIGGLVGYYSLGTGTSSYDLAIIPIMATLDYPLGDSFYVGADAGYSYALVTGGGIGAVGSTLAVAPKAGANFGPVHVEAKYQLLDLSYLSAVVGFSF